MHACVQLNMGIIAIDTQEPSEAEKHLNRCSKIIKDVRNAPEIASITLCLFNHLGIMWSKREITQAKVYLDFADQFYREFKASGKNPVDIEELFEPNIETYNVQKAWAKFEKSYSLTLYYLAQVYGLLGDTLKSGIFCHQTLKRQLESGDYEPIEWALNTATLSQFFIDKNGFKQARHHLAASTYMLNKFEGELKELRQKKESEGEAASIVEEDISEEELSAKEENLKHRSADVARCWAKYGLLLLASSKDRLVKYADDEAKLAELTTDLANFKLEDDSTITADELQNLYFPTLDLSEIENQVTDQFILVFADAKQVFLNIQQWLNKAHTYYSLETLASDYIEIVQDQSQMYEALLFFDSNPDNRCKMYKRSADLLETAVKQINPTYYMGYCRQLWFRLGEIYTEILDIKMEIIREVEKPNPHQLTKVNSLVDRSIANYRTFIKSFKDYEEEKPTSIGDALQKPFVMAYFHIAALYNRYITVDKQQQIDYCELSLVEYKRIKEYCEKNPNVAKLVPNELHIVNEMIELLPMKVQRLKSNVAVRCH